MFIKRTPRPETSTLISLSAEVSRLEAELAIERQRYQDLWVVLGWDS